MAAAGLYKDRGLSPYHSPLPSESPYTPLNAVAYIHGGTADPHEASSSTPFATAESVDAGCQYLASVLQDLGLSRWQLQADNTAGLLNSMFELVQQQQALLSSREALQDELHKLKVDVKTADKTIQRLQCQSEQKAQEAGGLNIKLRQLDTWYREETDRWSAEREQLTKKCAQLEQRHVQFQHELRRKDAEFEKLQKQLASQLTGSKRALGKSSSIGNSTQPTGRLVTTTRNGVTSSGKALVSSIPDTRRATKAELEDIHKRVIEAYEADKRELQEDNAALRKALHDLEREHMDLLNGSDCRPNGAAYHPQTSSASAAPPAAAAAAAGVAGDSTATLQQMQSKLEALRIRKQRITGSSSMDICELQQHAQSASERLLMAKLLEASRIMAEQEEALNLAIKTVPGLSPMRS